MREGGRTEEEMGGRGERGGREEHSIAKRPTDTKGRRMTGTKGKPALRNKEEGDGKDGRGVWGESDSDLRFSYR